jgi:hypothetical protein
MIPVLLVSAALLALAMMIVIEVLRMQHEKRRKPKMRLRRPRRQPLLEDRIRDAFIGPRQHHGDIFVSYMIWRRENETRLELFAGESWLKLNSFTRSIVVRHLWRALEQLVQGSVVIVDMPPQQWSQKIDAKFEDHGVDPWAQAPAKPAKPAYDGPLFLRE